MQYQLFVRRDGNLHSLTLPYQHRGIEPATRLLHNPVFLQVSAHRTEPAPLGSEAMPLFMVEDDRDNLREYGTRTTWGWNGGWFERVLEERIRAVGGLAISMVVYRDVVIEDGIL